MPNPICPDCGVDLVEDRGIYSCGGCNFEVYVEEWESPEYHTSTPKVKTNE